MASIRSKIINTLLRNRHLFQGKWCKEVFTAETSIDDFRALCEKGAARYNKLPAGIQSREAEICGMKSLWVYPQEAPAEKVVLYVHGGGYVSGSCSDHRGVVAKFAAANGYRHLLFEYRLAPEFPFPAALDDALAVYEYLLANGYNAGDILIAGESAGGGLSLALLLAIKDKGLEMPAAAVAISPWTDLSCSGESYHTKNKVSVAPLDSWNVFAQHYAGGQDVKNPLISPLFGDLSDLPPLFIIAGMDDELFDDGRVFAEKAREQGVDVTFRAGKGMVHCYPLLAPMFPEATAAMKEISGFIRKNL
jgi:acetyl esterase/lipase